MLQPGQCSGSTTASSIICLRRGVKRWRCFSSRSEGGMVHGASAKSLQTTAASYREDLCTHQALPKVVFSSLEVLVVGRFIIGIPKIFSSLPAELLGTTSEMKSSSPHHHSSASLRQTRILYLSHSRKKLSPESQFLGIVSSRRPTLGGGFESLFFYVVPFRARPERSQSVPRHFGNKYFLHIKF